MNAVTVLSWALCGLAVGLVARFLIPGRQRMTLPMTAGLGVVGALLGGFLYWAVQGRLGRPYALADDAWHGWVVAVLGAMVVLLCYVRLYPKRRWWQP